MVLCKCELPVYPLTYVVLKYLRLQAARSSDTKEDDEDDVR